MDKVKVVITGGSGYIGSFLSSNEKFRDLNEINIVDFVSNNEKDTWGGTTERSTIIKNSM